MMANEMRDRLVELILNADNYDSFECKLCDKCDDACDCCYAEKIADYLLDDGWIRPPCKVGDTLYAISQMKDKRILPFVNKYEATSIKLGKRKCVVYHEVDGYIKLFKQEDFGKTVFLTKEEAEQKLKEMRGE